MKKIPSFFIYLAVAAVLGGYIYFFERKPIPKEEKKGKVFADLIADDVTGLRVENLGTTVTADKVPVEILKDPQGNWQITAPRKYKADEGAVRSALNTVGELTPESVIPAPSQLADYGLKDPAGICSFTVKGGKVRQLFVGGKDITGSSSYVRADDGKDVYLVSSGSIDGVLKKLSDFRDHSFFKVDSVLAKKIRLTHGAQSLTLEKDKDDLWNITSPIRSKGNETKVKDLLASVGGLRADGFEKDDPGSLSVYGLDPPSSKVEVWFDEKGKPKTILFGKKKKGTTEIFAKQEDLPYVVLVPSYSETNLDLKVSDYRDKGILAFDAAPVKTLSVKRGMRSVTFQKDDKGQWTSLGRPEASSEAGDLVGELSRTSILEFPETSSGSGLKDPAYAVEVGLGDGTTRTFRFGKTVKDKIYLASDKGSEAFLVSSSIVPKLEVCFKSASTPIPMPAASPVKR